MLPVESAFKVYTDLNGNPLDNGYVYFGLPNQNPITEPVTVYWDAAGTQPAAQPLRTVNGYIVRGGTPANVFIDVAYSQLVQDKNRRQVYYSRDSSEYSISAIINTLLSSSGASIVGYLLNSVGAVVRSVMDWMLDRVSVTDFMTTAEKADYRNRVGSLDLTAAFQAALTATRSNGNPTNSGKTLYWQAGTGKITQALVLGSNQNVIFEPGVIINLVPSGSVETTSAFVCSNQDNVFLLGNGATINGTRTGAVIEGNAAGIFLFGVRHFRVQDFNINNMATDGVTVSGDDAGSGPCTDGIIQNIICNNNRRQGFSLISARRLALIGCRASNTNGAPAGPWAGLDIEPEADSYMEDVDIFGFNSTLNNGPGIQITPGQFGTITQRRFDVNIFGGRSLNDGAVTSVGALHFANGGALTNQVFGEVNVYGYDVESPKGRGINFSNWDADKCPRVVLDNVGVLNPNYTQDAANNYDRSGFVVYADSSQAITNLGNIVMRDCWAQDSNASAWMVWGFVLDTVAGKVLKNIRIDNPKSINFAAASKMDVATRAASIASGMTDTSVNYSYPSLMTSAGSQNIGDYAGKRINVTASSTAQTLPLAANCVGTAYEVQNAVGVNSTSVTPGAGDTIRWYGDVANVAAVLDSGGYIKLRSRGTEWQVEQVTGQYRIGGTTAPRKVIWTAAAPAAGTWTLGDVAINAAPAVGSPKGWRCTVGGTPGTWVSEGNL